MSDSICLVYISPDRKCYLLTKDATEFLTIVSDWSGRLTPYDGVTLYPTKDKAREKYEIIDFEKTGQYQTLKNMMKR